jgi:hypothetical protein
MKIWEVARHPIPRMIQDMKPAIDPKLVNDPLFRELMAEGLAMQDRFAAEPVYAKTGKGFLKSAGVEELKQIKAAQKRNQK